LCSAQLASHLWEKKEMVGVSIQYVSGNIVSSLVGSFDVYDFILWGMRQSVYFLIYCKKLPMYFLSPEW